MTGFIKPLYTPASEIPTLSGEPPLTGYYKEYPYGDSNGVWNTYTTGVY